MRYVLILDLGTGGVHACLADRHGNLSANSYEEIAYIYDPAVGGYDLDAENLFQASKRQIRATLEKAGPGVEVAALGITSQRHGCFFLDEKDAVLGAHPNLDGRANAEANDVAPDGETIFTRTGRWPACWFPAVRLAWYRKHRPELYARFKFLFMFNEYVAYRLTGERVSEWTNAIETMFFDIDRRDWSPEMIRLFGAEKLELNRVVPIGAVGGTLSGAIASELGLPKIPVVMAASDTQSAVLGCGDIKPGEVVVVNGSTTPLFMPLDAYKLDPERRVYTDPYYDEEWALEGNCNQSGLVHRKLMDQLLGLIRRLPGQEKLERKALYGLFSGPEADPGGVTVHWGPMISNISRKVRLDRLFLTADNDECDIFTSIIPAFVENLAFAIHENAALLARTGGVASKNIYLTGGGSKDPRLQRALAALNPDKRILLMRELETTSRGVAIQCWRAVGEFGTLREAFAAADTASWSVAIPENEDPALLARYARWREEQPA